MASPLYRNFLLASDAENARNALLAAGFPMAAVHVTPHQALPPDTATRAVETLMNSLTPDSVDGTDTPRPRPAALVTVDPLDDEQRRQADAIMQHFHAIDA